MKNDTGNLQASNNTIYNRKAHNRLKVCIAMGIGVFLGALGDISLSHGMKEIHAIHADNPAFQIFISTITNPFVILGIILLTSHLVFYLMSLSWEDLSFVLPLTAGDYVLVTILAFFILNEDVSPIRWIGSLAVAAGIVLVVRS